MIRGHVAPCEISARGNAQLLIGDRVFLNQGVVIAAKESIEIGDDTLIGDFSAIYDSNYHQLDPSHPDKPRPVTIGKNVWLGNGVLVLPGSQIGDHTVVAARSVVKGSLPPRVLAAGNPAVVVRQLEIPGRLAAVDGACDRRGAGHQSPAGATRPPPGPPARRPAAGAAVAPAQPVHAWRSSLLVANDHRSVTSRSMSGGLNVCEAESDLCRLLPQVKCLTLKSQPRYFVRIAQKTGRDV